MARPKGYTVENSIRARWSSQPKPRCRRGTFRDRLRTRPDESDFVLSRPTIERRHSYKQRADDDRIRPTPISRSELSAPACLFLRLPRC